MTREIVSAGLRREMYRLVKVSTMIRFYLLERKRNTAYRELIGSIFYTT